MEHNTNEVTTMLAEIKYAYNKNEEYTRVKCGKMHFDLIDLNIKQAKKVMQKSKAHQWRANYLLSQQPIKFSNDARVKNNLLSMSNAEKYFYVSCCQAVSMAISEGYSIDDATAIGNAIVDGDDAVIVSMMPTRKLLSAIRDAQRIAKNGRVA